MLLFIFLFQLSCTRQVTIYNPATYTDGNKTGLIADTTVNGIWDGNWKVLSTVDMSGLVHKIHGKGTLTRWIIDAPLTEQIFDSSINFGRIRTYGDRFSTAWYGASSSNDDNWRNFQKSINVCMANHLPCFTPNGTYKYSSTLNVRSIANNAYQFCSIHFFGDASYWDQGSGTTLRYTGTTGPAFNMQLNKGSEIDHIQFFGLWKSPGGSDSVYYNLSEANYKDQSGNNLKDNYCGIAVDWARPLDGVTNSGSTGIHLHEVSIGNFSMLLAMSQNGITLNDDVMRVENLHLFDGKYGIVSGQAQEKDMQFRGIYSWGSIYCILSIGKHGAWQGGDYSFDGANIAGRCIQVFDISVAHWFSTHIDHWFCESIARVGTFSAQMPVTIDNSNFDCVYPSTIGRQIVINSNSTQIQFNNCTIRYYDNLSTDIWVRGPAIFNNCYFGGGKIINK